MSILGWLALDDGLTDGAAHQEVIHSLSDPSTVTDGLDDRRGATGHIASSEDAIDRAGPLLGIDLRIEIPEHFPPLHTDRELLREIMINLLHNGAEFTSEGEVVFAAELLSETVGTPPDTVSRQYAVLSVRDTGIGIAQEDIPKVFEAFRQIDGSILETLRAEQAGVVISWLDTAWVNAGTVVGTLAVPEV